MNPYQAALHGGDDAFITKFSVSGSSLIYSTFLGGGGTSDYASDIVVDATGAAYVTGTTTSTDFPTLNPYQGTIHGSSDAFLTKLTSSGANAVYSTYLGGTEHEEGNAIALDISANAFIMGGTNSSDFPTRLAYQDSLTLEFEDDLFLTKFSNSGASLIYSTYLGGTGDEYSYGIAVDHRGNAIATGYTFSTDFPVMNPYQSNFQGGSYDVFVTKFEYNCCNVAGDADAGNSVNIGDVTWLIAYIFLGGLAPECMSKGDPDGGGSVNIGDVVYLIGYIFLGGGAPVCGP